jgi:aspartate dehydrogenase
MTVSVLGIIGMGAIGTSLCAVLERELEAPLDQLAVLVRPTNVAAAEQAIARLTPKLAKRINVSSSLDALLKIGPDLVVECAGHAALAAYGADILRSGCDLLVVSSGALTDDALTTRLVAATSNNASRLTISSGAIGGIDMISAARLSGITSLVYTSRKPPAAWRGSPAEAQVDLATLREATVFYEGTAREAARDYPKNANVAATLALAGPGLDQTRVRLIADPASPGNVHHFTLVSGAAEVEMRILAYPSPDNPRTSAITALAVAREVLNRTRAIAIG